MAQLFGLTTDDGYLPFLVLLTSCMASAAGLAAIYPFGTTMTSKLYVRRPEWEFPLVGRIFGILSLYKGIIRFYAAQDIHNSSLSALAIATYVLFLAHFLSERYIFRTLYIWPTLAESITMLTTAATWMLLERHYYVPSGFDWQLRLPGGTGYLSAFLLGTAAMAITSGVVYIIYSPQSAVRKLYDQRPDLGNPIASRLFGVFCIILGLVRIAAAYDLSNPALYQLAMGSYAVCAFHFACETLVYRSISVRKMAFAFAIIAVGLTWMTLQRDYYLGAA